jgi:hypothetical protein
MKHLRNSRVRRQAEQENSERKFQPGFFQKVSANKAKVNPIDMKI